MTTRVEEGSAVAYRATLVSEDNHSLPQHATRDSMLSTGECLTDHMAPSWQHAAEQHTC